MCSNDWYDAVGIPDGDGSFEVWEESDERRNSQRMKYTVQDQNAAPQTVVVEDLQNDILGNGSISGSQTTSKIEGIVTTEIDIIGPPFLNPASKDAISNRVTAEDRKSSIKNSGDKCPVEHSRKNKRLKIRFPSTTIKYSGGRENNEDPMGISDEKY
ncbi:hypothetical protein EYC80_000492 [Monilinia laxa]|uniref:Uncharacterized protein n=1 Tax=Monilinia laxa TaxID=61186 RepID=A0A5N6KAW9_MONLA|nr:hypothetical protein EYC80_000492 [Monilinia laxa]